MEILTWKLLDYKNVYYVDQFSDSGRKMRNKFLPVYSYGYPIIKLDFLIEKSNSCQGKI